MSLLSKFYYHKYMLRTLTGRMSAETKGEEYKVPKTHSLLSNVGETYETITNGFFSKAGEPVQEE